MKNVLTKSSHAAVEAPRRWKKRSVVLVIVAGLLYTPAVVLAATGFNDVPDNHTHAEGITWTTKNGITKGCGNGTNYCPSDPVSRGQMATFLHRLSGHAKGVAPSVDAATVQGLTAAQLKGQKGDSAPSASAFASNSKNKNLGAADTAVLTAVITTTVPSTVLASTSMQIGANGGDDDRISCRLADGPIEKPISQEVIADIPDGSLDRGALSLNGAMTKPAGTYTINVWCKKAAGDSVNYIAGDLIVWATAS